MSQTRHRILIVDDEPAILRMLKTVLGRYGFCTEEARDGRDAMDLLLQRPFDVILSDVNMPGYPGIEFLRGVRERDLDVPVILMTGKPTIETSSRAVEFGAFRYLLKPIMPLVLKDTLDRAIVQHEATRFMREMLEAQVRYGVWPDDRPVLEAPLESGAPSSRAR